MDTYNYMGIYTIAYLHFYVYSFKYITLTSMSFLSSEVNSISLRLNVF